jgi:putative redox protein
MMEVRAQLKWTDGLQFIARAGGSPAVVIDSHEGASGPSPMELILIGVAGCTAVDVITIMKKRRADVRDFQINITGTRADEYPRRYTEIHIEYVLHGAGLKTRDVERAIELSHTKYCSATASLSCEIEHTYRVVELDEAESQPTRSSQT